MGGLDNKAAADDDDPAPGVMTKELEIWGLLLLGEAAGREKGVGEEGRSSSSMY